MEAGIAIYFQENIFAFAGGIVVFMEGHGLSKFIEFYCLNNGDRPWKNFQIDAWRYVGTVLVICYGDSVNACL